jgi:regulatory protein
VDGGPFATVAAADVAALGLSTGLELDDGRAAAVEGRAEVFSARVVALRMLGYRALPGREIGRRLVRKGHDRAVVDEVVEGLRAQGLVDDAEFARHSARTRIAHKRLGPARLQADLRRLGVDERTAAEAVQDTLARERIDPRDLLHEAAARKLRQLRGLERAVQRRRLRAFLVRRGFAAGEIIEVLRDLMG